MKHGTKMATDFAIERLNPISPKVYSINRGYFVDANIFNI